MALSVGGSGRLLYWQTRTGWVARFFRRVCGWVIVSVELVLMILSGTNLSESFKLSERWGASGGGGANLSESFKLSERWGLMQKQPAPAAALAVEFDLKENRRTALRTHPKSIAARRISLRQLS